MFFLRGPVRWWLFTVVVFSILLSWGKNFNFLTNIFLDYFPGYNKFRTVSMILVMVELAMPLLALLAMQKLLFGEYTKKQLSESLKYSLYIIGGICLLFALFPGMSDLSSPKDSILMNQGAGDLVGAIKEDRASLLRSDSFRSLIFVLLTAGLLFAYQQKKLKQHLFLIGLGLLVLVDLWPVNKRYLNSDNFVRKNLVETPFKPYQADLDILKDKGLSYRVLDLSQGEPFNSSRASYFHKSIGGYHGAKMRRYQEIYDHYIKENTDPDILDMLNTKYIIRRNPKDNKITAIRRTSNLGNAWFVSEYEMAENADQEIALLGEIDPSKKAVIDQRFSQDVEDVTLKQDSTASIKLTEYAPNKMVYAYSTPTEQIAVFSEIYYPKGWLVSINGKPATEFRADYILRAMVVPAGEGKITFEFRPKAYYVGAKISLAGSVILVLLTIGVILKSLGVIKIQTRKDA